MKKARLLLGFVFCASLLLSGAGAQCIDCYWVDGSSANGDCVCGGEAGNGYTFFDEYICDNGFAWEIVTEIICISPDCYSDSYNSQCVPAQ
jgi:hypothetical protein